MSRKALGKGLAALIPERPAAEGPGVALIPVDQIAPNPYQPRKVFAPEALADLMESIRTRGVLQPILVRMTASGYELIAGERRWRAAHQAGLREIPALVKEANSRESLIDAVVENVQRNDLNPIEAAKAYHRMAEEFDLTQEEVAGLVSKDRASVANHLRLLKLPSAVQDDLADGRLTMGHARALLGLTERQAILKTRDLVLAKGLSVRETEALVARLGKGKRPASPPRRRADPHLAALEEDLKRRLGTRVRITGGGKSGTIQVHYHDSGDLDRLLEILLAGER